MLNINDLTLTYPQKNGEKYVALNRVKLCVDDGEIAVIIGKSGCGKTSLLKAIAGLLPLESGNIQLNGIDITKYETKDRNLAIVSQSIALYPSMTVYDNFAMPLRAAKVPAEEIKARVKEAAELLEIDWLLSRKPAQLSLGQQQRVALGRALIKCADLYLFDEPFCNLDTVLREKLQLDLLAMKHILNAPILFVTHDQREAMVLADQLIVMVDGEIRQCGKPLDIYHHPIDDEVKSLVCEESYD